MSRANLAVRLVLGEPFATLAGGHRAALVEGVAVQVDACARALGLPVRSDVRVNDAAAPAVSTISVRIDGQECQWAEDDIAGQLVAAVRRGEPWRGDLTRPAVDLLAELDPAELAAAGVLAVAESVDAQPGCLVTRAVAAAWGEAIGADPDECFEVLRATSSAAVSVGDEDAVRTALDAAAPDLSPLDRAECLIDQLAPADVGLVAPAALLEELLRPNDLLTGAVGPSVRQSFADENGFAPPPITVLLDDEQPPHCFAVRVNHLTTRSRRALNVDQRLIRRPPPAGGVANYREPTSGLRFHVVGWDALGDVTDEDHPVWDAGDLLLLEAASVLGSHAGRLLTLTRLDEWCDAWRAYYPRTVDTAIAVVGRERLCRVLRSGIGIRTPGRNLELLLSAVLEALGRDPRAGDAALGDALRSATTLLMLSSVGLDVAVGTADALVAPASWAELSDEQLAAEASGAARARGEGAPKLFVANSEEMRVRVARVIHHRLPEYRVVARDQFDAMFGLVTT